MARERRNPRQPDPRKRKDTRNPNKPGSGKKKRDGSFKQGTSRSAKTKMPVKHDKDGNYIPKWKREAEETVRLNKYIANAGICSRREADELIKAGVIKVNGKVVTELGTKVGPEDKVHYEDQLLSHEKKRYILLNKQKGYVTTTKDPHAKNTVMELIASACKERIYPVGRLDRNTVGLLLFTNDGELSKKLMHPSSKVKKLYHVVLDQPLKKADIDRIAKGIELEDGMAKPDSIAYDVTANDKREVGVELHSGKNRIIRRMFEALGYKVVKLDRVVYAGLTKKNLPRGKWRFLTEQEVRSLKKL
jgi:23S rRNA pseudouridine2605 synthase